MSLITSLAIPKMDGVKCYIGDDTDDFLELLERCVDKSSGTEYNVVAEFADSEYKAYESTEAYLRLFPAPVLCTAPSCTVDHAELARSLGPTGTAPPKPQISEEEMEKFRSLHEEGCRKIVDNYVANISGTIVLAGVVGIYNRVQATPRGEPVPDDLRREIHAYVKLHYYKTAIVPLRNRDDMGKLLSIVTVFDESESDDIRANLAQSIAPSASVITLSRSQRWTRDRLYLLHCLAFFANLRFDQSDDPGRLRAGDSMYM